MIAGCTHPPAVGPRTLVMRHLTSALVLSLAVLTGCASAPAATGDSSPAPAADSAAQVDIVDFAFEPAEQQIAAGETVEWSQSETSTHTVTFEDGEESEELGEGDTYTRTFDEPGSYEYACFFHPQMTGTITVE